MAPTFDEMYGNGQAKVRQPFDTVKSWLAKTKPEGFESTGGTRLALRLVGDEDDRLAGGAKHRGKMPVEAEI